MADRGGPGVSSCFFHSRSSVNLLKLYSGAKETLQEYWKSIGGKPAADQPKSSKKRGRGRPSMDGNKKRVKHTGEGEDGEERGRR